MEDQKQNDESKSSGMELLENVIKSNERNILSNSMSIEYNAQLQGNIESLISVMVELQQDLDVVNHFYNDILRFYEKEQLARNRFLASIPSKTEMTLRKETLDYLENFQNRAKKMRNFIWGGRGAMALGIIILLISIHFATNWYKESIRSKSETRQEILKEIAREGKNIYDINQIKKLNENTRIIEKWIDKHPKDADKFLRFKDGYEAK